MPRAQRIGRSVLALSLTVLLVPAGWSAARAGEAARSGTQAGTGQATAIPLENLAVTTTRVASGLQRPTAITAPDDDSGRLFITEKAGIVRSYHPDTGLAGEPLADLTGAVDPAGNERGLLGIAAAPDFAESRLLYVSYTRLPDDAVTLARYDLDDGELEEVLTHEHAENSNHNGGQLAFGPDGKLYWGIGDGGGAGDPHRNGQNLTTLLGKVLRLDVTPGCGEPDQAYCVPRDNPFADTDHARGEIWAYGLRNPWRFSFDDNDGSLWIGDVGQGGSEEVDHLPADGGGANFGWSCREGLEVFDPAHCADDADYTDPVFTYPTSVGGCSVIGGEVYRGKQYANLAGGTYLATDYCSSTVWGLRAVPGGGYESAVLGETPTQVTTFGRDADGELYVANDLPGQLHRVSFEER
ncbi:MULTISPECIES: PQQ-dependent sugar dehydrogenase [Streptomyces]|uniref:PQQ-dependent sugar dehydrogenase n=1 Tax=Streptomyces lycii TaxID=2654337 RepID=A0ABQ7FJ31_9ACTN|nr:PQQ-dependent sugar dehydrogenase [Streptomyces lycii]KAF4407258.1 PQQ-dependent sugar dehydrogenase [Streptomyces lycii]